MYMCLDTVSRYIRIWVFHRYPICGPPLPFFLFFNSSLLWDVFIINSVEQLHTLPKTQSEIDIYIKPISKNTKTLLYSRVVLTTGAWGMDLVSSSPLFSTTPPLFSKFSYKSFLFQTKSMPHAPVVLTWVFGNVWSCSTLFIMKTSHKSDELKKGGVHKSGTYGVYDWPH